MLHVFQEFGKAETINDLHIHISVNVSVFMSDGTYELSVSSENILFPTNGKVTKFQYFER